MRVWQIEYDFSFNVTGQSSRLSFTELIQLGDYVINSYATKTKTQDYFAKVAEATIFRGETSNTFSTSSSWSLAITLQAKEPQNQII